MAQLRSMEARTGRKLQRYGAQGERLVAGVVPLSLDKTKVLLVTSTTGGWVLPKGGWETDEAAAQAACREAWEEAGVVCHVQYDLGVIQEPPSLTPKAYQFFEVAVDKEEAAWPEQDKRARRWMTYREAAAALAKRPPLLEALNRSSIKKA
ncbi:hypothetical protein L228DRAFT_33912 [Xylona heveae TC161]|uniref:Nudix hydrolase domain-containing protein n=1 Tax=Xylona heveae (strain CBS 132557 / TC161) TaxID=1328760 RepID=A0A165A6J9_XYLHT|nr:hypothetical protein L228DRAFT_33912 [Xylona heveae TC161]KZF20023.1 hypothetical protein L228DRAFT_33912 [Xylona heveae TC161]